MARAPKLDPSLAAATDAARRALLAEDVPEAAIGGHVSAVADGDRLVTHRFAALLSGYGGWEWYATLARVPRGKVATVCETGLLPGASALLAPDWVPWSERVRPEELAAQRAAEAAEAAEASGGARDDGGAHDGGAHDGEAPASRTAVQDDGGAGRTAPAARAGRGTDDGGAAGAESPEAAGPPHGAPAADAQDAGSAHDAPGGGSVTGDGGTDASGRPERRRRRRRTGGRTAGSSAADRGGDPA